MPTLNDYKAIENHLFVRVEVEYYKSSPSATPTSTVLTFSDLRAPFVINGETYIGLGNLLGITSSSSELRTSNGELSISISGIPNASIYEIVNSRIKGCPVRIYRGLFDPVNGTLLNVDNNVLARYRGFVNNYSLQEDYDIQAKTSSNSIVLICNSAIDVLQNKVTGRTTSPASQKKFYPNDISMDRVPNLENATFNFGAPQ
jgi:hypothetical protein